MIQVLTNALETQIQKPSYGLMESNFYDMEVLISESRNLVDLQLSTYPMQRFASLLNLIH